MHTFEWPGSQGEHILQERQGSTSRALAFYEKQMLHRLNSAMQGFIAEQEMVFIATADAHGECDCSFRAGTRGFVRALDERILVYPEYRGNGVFASLGNMLENPHIGMIFVDFFRDTLGLHVNGRARVLSAEEFQQRYPVPHDGAKAVEVVGGRQPVLWVEVEVKETYVHCSKHIPLLAKLSKEIAWGTDDQARKKGDYFGAKHCSRSEVNGHAKVAWPTERIG
jgi:predicted pyridoxine 5'-phosphate oxidase superfamily flavin-nucleotide-binding protein